ncbi:MAG: V-type ATP synthase subunit D [Thermoguttaceae bacterium]|nr:V-type ATP synthase subunit D [Thermoguttaceae bacterium]
MPQKIKLTRPELKRHRDRLTRFQRYLPMLKLKQQQLQVTLGEVANRRREAEKAADEASLKVQRYEAVLADLAGVPVRQYASPEQVHSSRVNIAGVEVPVFEGVTFPEATYSLFGTPVWVDQALADLREQSRRQAVVDVLREEEGILQGELARTIQRVNLFEKVMIPESREAIRRIRIRLGDELAAGVGRAKIAKKKLAETYLRAPEEVDQ